MFVFGLLKSTRFFGFLMNFRSLTPQKEPVTQALVMSAHANFLNRNRIFHSNNILKLNYFCNLTRIHNNMKISFSFFPINNVQDLAEGTYAKNKVDIAFFVSILKSKNFIN